MGYNKNLDESYKMAKEAILAYIERLNKHGEKIIDDSQTYEGILNLTYA